MLKWFLWFKYLRKRKIVLLCVAAVGLSATLLIVVASLFGGFIKAVEKTGRETFGDIYCNPGVAVPECRAFLERLESMPQVTAAASVFETYGLLHLGRGNVRAVRILGIDPAAYARTTGFKNALLGQAGRPGAPDFSVEGLQTHVGGFLGIGIFGRPDPVTDRYDFERALAAVGTDAVLTTGRAEDNGPGRAGGELTRRHLKFRIADVVFTGIYVRDEKDLYLPGAVVRDLMGSGHREVIQIRLADAVEPEAMLAPVRRTWEDHAAASGLGEADAAKLFLSTSRRMQEYFIAELRKQMSILMLIFGVVCSAAVLLIFCVFYMIVTTRRPDIAIVKSCGAASGSVAAVFMGFGACVGLVGALTGAVIGAVVTRNINAIENWIRLIFGLKLWRSSTYMFEKIPNEIDLAAAGWIALWVIAAAAAGALIPAVAAARTRPVEVLRYE
jgi:lipoprotein-releasing system permease protein